MLKWILEWFHMVIISMHDWAAAPCSLVVRLWLSLVIELCADSESVVTGFKNRKGLFSAQMWISLSRRHLLSRMDQESGGSEWRSCGTKVGSSGRKADFVSSLPKVLPVSGDDTAPCKHGSILGLPWQLMGLIYYPRSSQSPLSLKEPLTCRKQT